MSHSAEGTQFTQRGETFEADAEADVGGTVVITVPEQNPQSQVRGIRFIKTFWPTEDVHPDPSRFYRVIHFEVAVYAGVENGTVPFDPPITLQVPYTDAIKASVDNNLARLKLVFLDDATGEWKTFGTDPIFDHIQTIEIKEDPKIAIVSGIERWADPHVGWHAR